MSQQRRFEVDAEAAGSRVDHFVAQRHPRLGRAGARSVVAAGQVRVDGRVAPAGKRLRAGQRVEIAPEAPLESQAVADPEAALRVVFEDRFLVVVDKPAGQASHPLRPGERGSLASALLARYPEMAGLGYSRREPGLLHRLDTDTSGLVLCAREAATFEALRRLLGAAEIDKRYQALVLGHPAAPRRHTAFLSARGKRVRASHERFDNARQVETELLQAKAFGALSLIELRVHHAARHQIRAHLSALGHPIAGDALYGGPPLPGLTRHFLHASALSFRHPVTGKPVALQASLPEDLVTVLGGHESG